MASASYAGKHPELERLKAEASQHKKLISYHRRKAQEAKEAYRLKLESLGIKYIVAEGSSHGSKK